MYQTVVPDCGAVHRLQSDGHPLLKSAEKVTLVRSFLADRCRGQVYPKLFMARVHVQLQRPFLLLEQQLLELCLLHVGLFIPVADPHTRIVASSALQLLFGIVLHDLAVPAEQHCTFDTTRPELSPPSYYVTYHTISTDLTSEREISPYPGIVA